MIQNNKSIETALALWEYFNNCEWDEARKLLSEDFKAHWPQSKEIISGPDNFIELNRNYPGTHKIEVFSVTCEHDEWDNSDTVITQVKIRSVMGDGKKSELFAVSFFTIEEDTDNGNKFIKNVLEYWAETYPAPSWRADLVETS